MKRTDKRDSYRFNYKLLVLKGKKKLPNGKEVNDWREHHCRFENLPDASRAQKDLYEGKKTHIQAVRVTTGSGVLASPKKDK